MAGGDGDVLSAKVATRGKRQEEFDAKHCGWCISLFVTTQVASIAVSASIAPLLPRFFQ
jgi:hypothetical protein